ncbi:MAG: glycoside hydrolase 43 family protein [Bacteroidaceae bacterium]|nr:glycoside hydrolase 43 family protein [Bacteroidaceae bacterium]
MGNPLRRNQSKRALLILAKQRKVFAVLLLLAVGSLACVAQTWGEWNAWGNQRDGTYRNPILPADYSDIDCIHVGEDYYAISSTFQYSPGMIILHSRNLVDWTIAGHAVTDITEISPEMSCSRMNRYGRGIWAGAIRYHKGRFLVYFGTPDEGYFMTSAPDVKGPWEPLHQLLAESGWDDCCPLFDDDGKIYFVGTCFADGYKTYIFRMTDDGRDIIPNSGVLVNEGAGREANKLMKWNGKYYHFYSEVGQGGRFVMMQRADSPQGPYSEKRQLSHTQREANEPNQGGIVEGPNGQWYFLTHHGTGDWSGRIASLLPVTWLDGWPILGNPDENGIGNMVWKCDIPGGRSRRQMPQSSDKFNAPILQPQWEWNYHPDNSKWSLAERRGFLRLRASVPLEQDNLLKAAGTLTQRIFRTPRNVVTTKISVSHMADGEKAGLCHYSDDFAMAGVLQREGKRYLFFQDKDGLMEWKPVRGRSVWLRSEWSTDGISKFLYSTDGITFHPIGRAYALRWGYYRGDRIGIFNYNNLKAEGFVDIDYFKYRY